MDQSTEPFDHGAAIAAIDPRLAELIHTTSAIGGTIARAAAPIDGVDLHALPADVSQKMRQRRAFLTAAQNAHEQFARAIEESSERYGIAALNYACPHCGAPTPIHHAMCSACARTIADAAEA